jgi:phosphate transport system ATP-binding protein
VLGDEAPGPAQGARSGRVLEVEPVSVVEEATTSVVGLDAAAETDAPSAPEEEPCVRFDDFGLAYGSFQAIRDVCLGVPTGKITALMGPSGCGKSTLLRSINRMNDAIPEVRCSGQVYLTNGPIYVPGVNLIDLRKRIGMVFQKPNPFAASVFDNVAWGPRIHGLYRGSELAEHVEKCLRRVALWDEVSDKLRMNGMSLSGGQQQRLCIARALAVEPEILLMDEPCSALDPIATDRIEELMRGLVPEYTIVIVTHNMQQASRVSDHSAVFWVDEGRTGYVIETGPTQQLFMSPENQITERYLSGRVG